MHYHLKTRIAIAVSLLTLGFLSLLSWMALTYFEGEFKKTTFSHFSDTLSVTEAGISGRVEHASLTLEYIRKTFPEEILPDTDKIQSFLEDQGTGLLTFDNGIFLFTPDGRLIAVNPRQDDIIGIDVSDRDYIKQTLATGRPYISAPFRSRQQHHHPIIMLTEPIIDKAGEIIAIMGGSFDLYSNNLLKVLIDRKVGKDGYYMIIDQQGTVVIHPIRESILLPADRFFAKDQMSLFSGSRQGNVGKVTVDGQKMIGSFQHISNLDWTLIALSPVAEDYAPIHRARMYLIFALAILSIVTVFVVRLLSNRLTSPLVDLAEQVRLQTHRQDAPLKLETSEYKELGDLANSIQLLMTDVSAGREDYKNQLAFLQNLVDTIPGPIFYKDSDFRYVGCNKAFEKFIGIPRDKLIGKSVFDIAPADLAKIYHRADTDLWQQGGEQVYETSVKYADGTLHDVIYYKKIFNDTNGVPAGLIGTFLDISDRKQSEQALRASEKRFRLLVENAADAFFLHDGEGRILDVNQQACASLGYSREELTTMNVRDVSTDYDSNEFKALQSVVKTDERTTAEDHHRRKDGSIFPVEVRLCHTVQDGGRTIALARDISERKRDEEALQQALHDTQAAKQQLDNIISSAADGLVVTDRRNRVTHINQIAEEMLRVDAETVIGNPFTKLFIDSQLREQAKAFLNQTEEDTHQFDFKLNFPGKQFPRIIQARSSMLKTETDNPVGLVTLLRDVSRERELDEIKSEFISTAAHEMRTPMSVIMGYIEILLGSDQFGNFSPEDQRKFLNEAYCKAEALTQIVDDLFDISRIEAGLPLPIIRSECDLDKIVRDVVNHYKKHTAKHQFALALDGEVKIHVDCNKMTQVFENLISNAVKYSPEGGRIEVRSTVQEGLLRIDVEDQGSGMTADQVERVFDKFYRVDSSNTAVRGLGLGMSIAKEIIAGHCGRIWVKSKVGEGTCVSLELPLSSSNQ